MYHGISEADAMTLCKTSNYVLSLVDQFAFDDMTYIVTKLAKGGNLLDHVESLSDSGQIEEQSIRSLFL